MLAPLLALSLGASSALAAGATGGEGHTAGSFEDGGSTLVSAMMVCSVSSRVLLSLTALPAARS